MHSNCQKSTYLNHLYVIVVLVIYTLSTGIFAVHAQVAVIPHRAYSLHNTVSMSEYIGRLNRVLQALQRSEKQLKSGTIPQSNVPLAIGEDVLPSPLIVETATGPVIVDNGPLVAEIRQINLRGSPGDLARHYGNIAEDTAALMHEVKASNDVKRPVKPFETKPTVSKILSASAYAPPEPSRNNAFTNWLRKTLFGKHSQAPTRSNVNFDVRPIIVIVVVGLVVFIVVWVGSSMFGRKRREKQPADVEVLEEQLLAMRDSEGLLNAGAKFASDRDFRTAYRFVYLALVVKLDEEQKIAFDRTKTNWEYYLASKQAIAQEFDEEFLAATRNFDNYWYGSQMADHTVYANLLNLYKNILATSLWQSDVAIHASGGVNP